jgi:hypothetical protein
VLEFSVGIALAIIVAGVFIDSRRTHNHTERIQVACIEGYEVYADAKHQWEPVTTPSPTGARERVRCATIEEPTP